MSANTEQRKLAAIMFNDMVGYSALSQRNEALAQELLEEHRALLRPLFARFNGTEIKTIGDAFLIEFHSALEAAQCGIEIQRALAKRNHDVPNDRRVEIKIGIHIGDVVHRGGDVYGDGVNIASRIEPLAGAGGICVSMDVERQIRNALEARFEPWRWICSASCGRGKRPVAADPSSVAVLRRVDVSRRILNAAGGWQTWTDVTKTAIPLSAGQQAMKVEIQSGGYDLNRIEQTRTGP